MIIQRRMCKVFGNFVLQKLLEIGSVEVKRVFAEQLVGDVLRLSLHAHGCRVIQKVLEEVSTDQQVADGGRPGRPELLAKKGRLVGGVGCPPNCRTSGKLRGNSG